jgi:hypothetical protein
VPSLFHRDDLSAASFPLSELPSLLCRDDFDNDSSLSSLSTIGDDTEDTTDRFFASFFVGGPDEEEVTVGEGDYDETDDLLDDYDETDTFDSLPRERTRRPNRFPYVSGDIFKSNYYRQYLCPEKREDVHRVTGQALWLPEQLSGPSGYCG